MDAAAAVAADDVSRRDSKISLSQMGSVRSITPQAASVASVASAPAKDGIDISEYTAATFGDDLYNENTPENRRILWKQDVRVLPLCSFIFLLCYMDRSNIGNALVMNAETGDDLQTELNITDRQYSIALMLFLISYALFEVPSNYFLKKLTPSKWIAFLMMSWGAITIGMGGVQNFASLTATRFLLGVAEAGLFPGLVFYLTFFYRASERSVRIAMVLASSTLAGAFGGVIAYGVSHMNRAAGLSAWRWLFVLEGIPSCLSAIAVFLWLPDYPETAAWLTPAEQELAQRRLAHNGSKGQASALTWAEALVTLRDARLYVHYAIYFCMSVPFSSLSLFAPAIINGLDYSSVAAQLMSVPPWGAAYVVTMIIAYTSDRYDARALHSAAMMLLGAVGFLASAVLAPDDFRSRYGCLIVACVGSFACIPPLPSWITGNLHSTSAAGLAIALNVSFGAPGQIVGVWIYRQDERARGYPTGHWTNVAMLLLGAAGVVGLRAWYAVKNREILRLGLDRPLWKL